MSERAAAVGHRARAYYPYPWMKVTALAGGIGAGKFLRGLQRVVPGEDLTVIVNVADDVVVHGLRVSPDPDSVTYWMGDAFDRERGWGRAGDTFRATEELRALGAKDAWFSLGDLDLATHLFRTQALADGQPLSAVTARVAERFGVAARILPASDDRIETRIDCVDHRTGAALNLHFQDYWVRRRASDQVKGVRYEGAATARPAAGVLEAIASADAIVCCPSNPVVSIAPILAVGGVLGGVIARRDRIVGVSGIVAGGPVAGMADKLMPAVGIEVSAAGVAERYAAWLSAWLIDDADAASVPRIEALGLRVGVTDTIMVDDARAEHVARAALDLLG
jgi:LPPG:FO 2-phospho-L-lactate transferase